MVDFPTPGGPVSPITRARPVSGASRAISAGSSRSWFSTRLTSRPIARARPARACVHQRRRASGRDHQAPVEDQGVALTTAATQGGDGRAAPPPLQLVRQVQDQPRTGRADRVTEGDRPAVHVDPLLDLVRAQPEGAGTGDADRREGLVDLDQVEVGDGDALLLRRGLDGAGRLQLQGGVRTGHLPVRADPGQHRQTQPRGRVRPRPPPAPRHRRRSGWTRPR